LVLPFKADLVNAPPNSLRNLNVGPIMKQWKKKKVEACFLACNTSRVKRHVGVSGWD
jgi:hypothetical protein